MSRGAVCGQLKWTMMVLMVYNYFVNESRGQTDAILLWLNDVDYETAAAN